MLSKATVRVDLGDLKSPCTSRPPAKSVASCWHCWGHENSSHESSLASPSCEGHGVTLGVGLSEAYAELGLGQNV